MQPTLEPPYLIVKPGVDEEEFYRLADEDSDWEYLDGRIIMHSPASKRHEDIFAFLLTLLRALPDERKGATVLGSRYSMRLDPKWSTEPDIVVIVDARRHLMRTTGRSFLDTARRRFPRSGSSIRSYRRSWWRERPGRAMCPGVNLRGAWNRQ
ncbi:MAG: hypothetical protein DMG09_26175 [Acidobacteria bacterium]|nr:MAG: hypothetical protein DMG09_26175 [Acidobacteriota bacterium]